MPRKKEVPAPEVTEINDTPEDVEIMELTQNPEGAGDMDYENMVNDGGVDSMHPADDAGTVIAESSPASKQRRRGTQTDSTAPILTLEVGAEVETHKDKENTVWHEIKNSQVTGTH